MKTYFLRLAGGPSGRRTGHCDGDDVDTPLRRARAAYEALPGGDGYVWIAAEARLARALRDHVIDTLKHPRAWIRAASYWTSGQANAHETIQS